MIRAALAAAALLLVASPAMPHSNYEWECCSDYDCAELDDGAVEERDGGWVLWDGRHIPYGDKRLKQSFNDKFHLCEQKWEPNTADRKILCFYVPIGGS